MYTNLPAEMAGFTLNGNVWPLNFGVQHVAIGAGGPRGFKNGTFGGIQPRPYATLQKRFICGFPGGTANSMRGQQGVAQNHFTGTNQFNPVGFVKPPTFTARVF